MSILSLLLLSMLAWAIYHFVLAVSKHKASFEREKHQLKHVKSIGLFAMITGILGQLIGLYTAFSAIEKAGDISPSLLAGGFKISMITTLYGMIIFLLSLLIWFLMDSYLNKQKD